MIIGGGALLNSAVERMLFVAGAALASLSWQTALAAFASGAGQRLPDRVQLITSVVGNLMVAGLGINNLIRVVMNG